jgi:hypothetical protein
MTVAEHDKIANLTNFHFNRIFGSNAKFCEKEPIEFFYEAYAKKNNDDLIKAIVKEIHEEYFKTIGNIQRAAKQESSFEKKCCKCKKTLDSSCFRKVYDKKYQFSHLYSYCRSCCTILARENYQKNAHYREKHIERCERYKDKYPDRVVLSKKECYERNKKKYYYKAQERRDLSKKWWNDLTPEKQKLLMDKNNLKKSNRDAVLKMWRSSLVD